MKSNRVSRRRFIQGLGLAGVAGSLSGESRGALLGAGTGASSTHARNVIFLVVDGMGTGTLSLAHHWSLRERGQPLNWMQLYDRPDVVRALQDTASASSPVTDSAAAASSWGCGRRIPNGKVNIDAKDREWTPLLVDAKAAGKATGLVTTCRVTHATPAGFAANVPSRNDEDRIASQYLERKVDVILGGGSKHFDRDGLIAGFTESGHAVVRDLHGLAAAAGNAETRRLLGLFSESHLPYVIDRENDPAHAAVPGLDQMTRAALEVLGRSRKGFVLQIEGGRVDHAGHANDPAAILREQLEFDTVIRTVSEFQKASPNSLVILTTDHGTGGCQLNGVGANYEDTGLALSRLSHFTASTGEILKRLSPSSPVEAVLQSTTGQFADPKLVSGVTALLGRAGEKGYALENELAKVIYAGTGIGWTSNNHTSECVELLAFGPGADRIPAFVENHELHAVMLSALA